MTALRRAVLPLAPLLLLGLVLLEAAARTGAGRRELLAAGAAVALSEWLPGVVVWRAVRPRDGWWAEDLAAGLGVGLALAVPAQVLAVATGLTPLAWLVPLLVAGTLLAVPQSRRRVREARSSGLPALWGIAVVVPALVLAADTWRFFDEPLRWRGWAVPYIDLPYHLALVGELSHRWPPEYPQVAGDRLYYHWFAHTWVAHVGSVSGTSLDVLLLRFVPVVVTVAVPALLAVVALRVTGRAWAGPLAVLLAFAVTELDVWHVLRGDLAINHASPTQGFGVVLLLTVLPLLVARWRGQVPLGWSTALLVPLLVVAGGAKGSVLPVLLAGCLLALAVALLRRTPGRAVVALDTVLVGVVLLVLMRTLFGGGDGGVSLTPFTSLGGVRVESFLGDRAPTTAELLVVTVLSLAAMLLPQVGALGVLGDKEARRDPVALVLAGAAASGVGAVVVLTHPGLSQFYFLRTAVPLLAVLAAWGTLLLLERAPRPAGSVATGAGIGVVAVLVVRAVTGPVAESAAPLRTAVLALLGFLVLVSAAAVAGGRALGRGRASHPVAAVAVVALAVAGVLPTFEKLRATDLDPVRTSSSPGAFHSSQVRAARFIRDHSDPDDLVATNRHCRRPAGQVCDARRFFVAAYAERRVLVEGWAYTRTANTRNAGTDLYDPRKGPFWEPELLALNDGFIAEPTAAAAEELHRLGVRWVFVDRTAPRARTLEPYATTRLRTRWATVYELGDVP